MNIFYNVREIEQLNNLDFCNNSILMYSYPFAFSLTILPNVPANLKSEQDIVKFLDNALYPICENTADVFSEIMAFVGPSCGDDGEPKTEKTSSARLSIESGLDGPWQTTEGALTGGSSTISTTNGFDITLAINQARFSGLFKTQADVGAYFEKAFSELIKQNWDITLRVGMMG